MGEQPRPAVVWGNCQARPYAELLRDPLAAVGIEVIDIPPVFELDEAALDRVRGLVRQAAVLVTQPVRDEYRLPGCGSEQLAALLPSDAAVVRIPSAYDSGPFPFQVLAHGSDGARADAPLTVYHDLRLLVAAAHGRSRQHLDQILTPAATERVDAWAQRSLAELVRREGEAEVTVSGVIRRPGGMHTVNHPANATLAVVAQETLRLLGVPERVRPPAREFLGATRAPIDATVARVVGWAAVSGWIVAGHPLSWREVATAHLDFYRERADVVRDGLQRFAERISVLGLDD